MRAMTAITERYDQNATLYERWWAPVLAAAASRLLDRCEPRIAGLRQPARSLRVLDLGTGTGTLAIEAAQRWPMIAVTAVDASAGMLDVARRRAGGSLPVAQASAIDWVLAEADSLPVSTASVDLVISSFVLQLVADREQVLRELHRVTRPGGQLAYVTWMAGRDGFTPAMEFDEAVYDLAIDEAEYEEEMRAGDVRSLRSAADELRRAGFRGVRTERERLDHLWDRDDYLAYKVGYDEIGLFDQLDDAMAEALESRARERLADLAAEAFRWHPPIVYATATRDPGAGRHARQAR